MYSPKQLAQATGMCVSQCRTLIEQSPDKICVSRNPNSQKKRYLISESGFLKAVKERQRKAQDEQQKREELQQDRHPKSRQRSRVAVIPGLTADGKIMNSRQLKEAGLWKGA